MLLRITLQKREKEADSSFHVHLRQGAMSKLVTPHVAQGGIKTAYVMVCHPSPSLLELTILGEKRSVADISQT